MFCTTECWDCNDRTCEHYVDKTKLYFENENNKKEIERLNKEVQQHKEMEKIAIACQNELTEKIEKAIDFFKRKCLYR